MSGLDGLDGSGKKEKSIRLIVVRGKCKSLSQRIYYDVEQGGHVARNVTPECISAAAILAQPFPLAEINGGQGALLGLCLATCMCGEVILWIDALCFAEISKKKVGLYSMQLCSPVAIYLDFIYRFSKPEGFPR